MSYSPPYTVSEQAVRRVADIKAAVFHYEFEFIHPFIDFCLNALWRTMNERRIENGGYFPLCQEERE